MYFFFAGDFYFSTRLFFAFLMFSRTVPPNTDVFLQRL